MIKFYHLISLFLFNYTFILANNKSISDPDINIEVLNITTNGVIFPNNTLSFNGADELVIEFDVRTTYTGSTTKYLEGTSLVSLYEPNEFDNETAQYYYNGVEAIQLIWNPIKLEHINNNNYSYTYRKKLLFKRSTIYNTGCSIVFRYGPKKLTYKIIGGTKTGNEPYTPSIANIKLTSLSYSDNSPIINNKIIIPDYIDNEIGTQSINLSFDFDIKYGSKLSQGYYPQFLIQIRHDEGYSTSLMPYFEKIISIDKGTVTIKNLQIKSSDIRSNDHLRILFYFHETQIDLDWALIKGNNEKPILGNFISDSQTIQYGQVSKPFSPSDLPYVDYSIRCSPNVRSCKTIYDYRYITSFQWQTKTQNTDWSNISGATEREYSPNRVFTENTYYRRLAYFNADQYSISNTTSVIINDSSITNNICCDQSLPLRNSQPQQINGDDISSNIYTYQWQFARGSVTSDFLPWQNIIGATSQNYQHIFNEDAISSNEKTAFRRLIKLNSLPISTGNKIIITRYTNITPPTPPRGGTRPPRSSSNKTTNLAKESHEDNINNTLIYPNPFVDNFSIEGTTNINQIKLYDSSGKTINIEKTQKSQNLIEVNTINLQPGIFLLKIDDTTFSKTLFKN